MIPIFLLFALWDHSYIASMTGTYDDNVFTYSPSYIDEFMNHIQAYRFPFETYDDLYTESRLDVRFRNTVFNNRTTTFNFGIKLRHHAINQQKDFQRLVIGLRQSFTTWAAKVSYRVIPQYVIRYYQDPAGSDTAYIACKTAYHTIAGKLSYDLLDIMDIDIIYRYSIDNYVDAFDWYDARGHTIGMDTEAHVSAFLNLGLSYLYKLNTLNGQTDTILTDETAVPDGSYEQHTLSTMIQIQQPANLPMALSIEYRYSFRNYRSTDPDDIIHYSRQQNSHSAGIEVMYKVKTGIKALFGYSYRKRQADSRVFPDIGSLKNFRQHRVFTGLMFYY